MTLASIVAPSKAAANYLNNGSFETGDFTGWTSGGNFEFTQVVTGPFYVYSAAEDGNFYVTGGPVGADATLSQTFSDTVGQTLNVSGWVNANGDDPSDLVFYFDGTALFSATDPVTDGWTDLSFLVTATGSDTFAVGFRDDPAYIALDNFSVEFNRNSVTIRLDHDAHRIGWPWLHWFSGDKKSFPRPHNRLTVSDPGPLNLPGWVPIYWPSRKLILTISGLI